MTVLSTMLETPPYRCPLCHDTLLIQGRSALCSQKHCFDIAKEGYINLLPVQSKKSKEPGDSRDMVQSRRLFLGSGHYAPLKTYLMQRLTSDALTESNLIDIGCGEGYYLSDLPEKLTISGCDIAKPAVRAAAKRYKDHAQRQFCVASAYDLPFFENSFDLALSVFSPIACEEVQRVLKPQGRLITVGPGKDHLKELAAHIYDAVQAHEGNFNTLRASTSFTEQNVHDVHYTIDVAGEQLQHLLRMTPYYWHTSAAKQKALGELEHLSINVHFVVAEFVLKG